MLRLVVLLAVIVLGLAPAEARGRAPSARSRVGMVEIVAAAARRDGVPVRFELAIVAVESGFDPRARNGTSLGLGQVKPGTAREAGCRGSLLDVAVGADCSARILAQLLRGAGGDWRRADAHYNAGRFARGSAGAGYAARVLARGRGRAG